MSPIIRLAWISLVAFFSTSPIRAAYLTDNQLDFWCDGKSLPSLVTPEVPPVGPGEINNPANSGLTLLGTAAAHLLRQLVVTGGDQLVSHYAYDRDVRAAMVKKYFPRGSTDAATRKMMQEFVKAGSTEPHINLHERSVGFMTVGETFARIKQLIAAGADVDAPMFSDLCLTPRDLLLRSHAESPALTNLDELVKALPPERVPPNEKGKQFLQRPFRNDPKARRFFELSDSPLRPDDVAALVPTKMRPCKIPESPLLKLCRNRATRESIRIANLWNPVGAPPSGDPSRDAAWFATLGRVSTVARDQFFYRDGKNCRKIFDANFFDTCDRSLPLAVKIDGSFRRTAYWGRRGSHDLRGDEVLPEGYHRLGNPPALFVVRGGVIERAGVDVDTPTAFIGPDIGSHHDVVAPGSEADTWDDQQLVAQLAKLPAILLVKPTNRLRCDTRCRATLATESIAAAADWKHHLRPLATDALFALETDLGLFVDNTFFASVSQVDAVVRANPERRGPGPVFRSDTATTNARDAASKLASRSVLGRNHAPFVGFTLLPSADRSATNPQYRTSNLQQVWKSYPLDCTLETALMPDERRDASACGRQARTLRLGVESGPLREGVVALIEDNRVVLSESVCLVDARDMPLSGWEDACTGARRRVPLVVVLRHELGHSLGLHDIGAQDSSVSDVMDGRIEETMRFTAQSRQSAREAIASPGPARHVNGMLRIAPDGKLEHVER